MYIRALKTGMFHSVSKFPSALAATNQQPNPNRPGTPTPCDPRTQVDNTQDTLCEVSSISPEEIYLRPPCHKSQLLQRLTNHWWTHVRLRVKAEGLLPLFCTHRLVPRLILESKFWSLGGLYKFHSTRLCGSTGYVMCLKVTGLTNETSGMLPSAQVPSLHSPPLLC